MSDDFEDGDGHKVADDENSSEPRAIVTKLGDEQADSRLLFNFGDLGGDLVIVIEGIQLSFPYQLGIFHLGASPTSLSF